MKHALITAILALLVAAPCIADPTTAASLPPIAVIKLDGDSQKGFEAERGKAVRLVSEKATEFRVLPGLKDPAFVSFESVDYPGTYLRHKDGVLCLNGRPKKKELLFEGNASFRVIHFDRDKYRFEASGLDGMFLAARKDGVLVLARNPASEQSTFVFAPVEVAAADSPAAPPAVAPAPAVASREPMPSSQIEPLLEPSLNAILAPLAEKPEMPRMPVEKLRATLGAGVVRAKTPSQKQIYEYGIAVCEALTKGMDDRAETRAAAVASGTLPSITTGGGIVKTSPLRGWDAGHAGDAIRGKEKDERQYADNRAKADSKFMESVAYKAWITRATGLRENVMALYRKLVQLEAQDAATAANAATPAAPVSPAALAH